MTDTTTHKRSTSKKKPAVLEYPRKHKHSSQRTEDEYNERLRIVKKAHPKDGREPFTQLNRDLLPETIQYLCGLCGKPLACSAAKGWQHS